MIIESICIACVVLGGLYSVSPTKKPEPTAAVAPALPPMASSNGTFYHSTTTNGDGSSAIVNLNLVNNNGSNQATPTPPTHPQYETTQQYLKKTFESLHFKDLASASYEFFTSSSSAVTSSDINSSPSCLTTKALMSK